MATQAKQKAPKVGEMVHWIHRDSPAGDKHECLAAVITVVYKNDPEVDRDYEKLSTVQVRPFGPRVSGNGQVVYFETEFSADGHRGTWHPIDACPQEA